MQFNISVSGLTSCGKTSYCKRLADSFGLQRISASALLLQLSHELGYQNYQEGDDKHHYRLREHVANLNRIRENNSQLVEHKIVALVVAGLSTDR